MAVVHDGGFNTVINGDASEPVSSLSFPKQFLMLQSS